MAADPIRHSSSLPPRRSAGFHTLAWGDLSGLPFLLYELPELFERLVSLPGLVRRDQTAKRLSRALWFLEDFTDTLH